MPSSPVTEFRDVSVPRRAGAATKVQARHRRALASWRFRREIQANLVSAAGAALCVAAGVLLAAGAGIWPATILFFSGSLCDLADGRIARAAADRKSSAVGKLVDSIADKVGEIGFLLGLLYAIREDSLVFGLALLAFGCGMLTSLIKAFAEVSRLDLEWREARVFGRAGRVVLLVAILSASAAFGYQSGPVLTGMAALLAFNGATLIWRSLLVIDAVALGWRRSQA